MWGVSKAAKVMQEVRYMENTSYQLRYFNFRLLFHDSSLICVKFASKEQENSCKGMLTKVL